MQDYRKLTVWQLASDLAVAIYEVTRSFPPAETWGLAAQMRRAAISISSNIAEGAGRGSRRDFARFLDMAVASGHELESQIIVASRLGVIADEDRAETLLHATGRIVRMSYSLARSARRGDAERPTRR
jgi:four helix bundle protein